MSSQPDTSRLKEPITLRAIRRDPKRYWELPYTFRLDMRFPLSAAFTSINSPADSENESYKRKLKIVKLLKRVAIPVHSQKALDVPLEDQIIFEDENLVKYIVKRKVREQVTKLLRDDQSTVFNEYARIITSIIKKRGMHSRRIPLYKPDLIGLHKTNEELKVGVNPSTHRITVEVTRKFLSQPILTTETPMAIVADIVDTKVISGKKVYKCKLIRETMALPDRLRNVQRLHRIDVVPISKLGNIVYTKWVAVERGITAESTKPELAVKNLKKKINKAMMEKL